MTPRRKNYLPGLVSALALAGLLFLFRNAFASIISLPPKVSANAMEIVSLKSGMTGIREIFSENQRQTEQRFDRVDQSQENLIKRVDSIYEIISRKGDSNAR